MRMNGRLRMSVYDEYQIVINEGQRRVIMRALTNTMANDRLSSSKGGTLSRPTQDEYMQLVRLFSRLCGRDGSEVVEGGLTTTPPQACPHSHRLTQLGVDRRLGYTLPMRSGRSGLGMFVAFEHGVMYVPSFATMVAVV